MNAFPRSLTPLAFLLAALSAAAAPHLPGVGVAMQEMVAKGEIAGAVTVVVTKDKTLHLDNTGHADLAMKRPMTGSPCSSVELSRPVCRFRNSSRS